MSVEQRDAGKSLMLETAEILDLLRKKILYLVFPIKEKKPTWCQCATCGGWHYSAKE